MLLIINTLLFEYGMALSCDCVLTVSNLSAEKRTPTETNSETDETFDFFSTKRNVLCAEPKNKRVFSLGEALLHPLLILPKRERCTDAREKFYICNRGDCFVCPTWF